MKRAPVTRAGLGLVVFLLVGLTSIAPAAARAADGYLGVHIQDVDQALAAALDLDRAEGVLVNEVVEGSPAAKAGLEQGDLILSVDGRDAVDSRRFTRTVRRLEAGETVDLEFLRKGERMKLQVKLGEVPESEQFGRLPGQIRSENGDLMWLDRDAPSMRHAPEAFFQAGGGGRLGVDVHGLDEDLGHYFGAGDGVLVLHVEEDSGAEKAGVRAGDVIVAVDDEPVSDAVDLQTVVRDHEPGDEVAVRLLRDRKEMTVDVELGEDAVLQVVRGLRGPHHAPRVLRLETAPDQEVRHDLQEQLEALSARLERLEAQLEEIQH